MSAKNLNVVVWNEFRHERMEEVCRNIYPDGIHGLIKSFLEADDVKYYVSLWPAPFTPTTRGLRSI